MDLEEHGASLEGSLPLQAASAYKSWAVVYNRGGGGIDAVLPLPYLCYPNTMAQFRRFVGEEVKNTLFESLRTLDPDNFDGYMSLLNGIYQYTYNLLCVRSEVFEGYCEWIFSMLRFMEGFSDKVPEIGSSRALSYAAEVLTSLYFLSREKTLNIAHVEKRIFV
ncbi:hypothetical protein FACS189475_03900 [Betaproteobacteria bacterium]|nr:hypothetical protein FACS189475_03900 [Betaproteobacteria bacterium]